MKTKQKEKTKTKAKRKIPRKKQPHFFIDQG